MLLAAAIDKPDIVHMLDMLAENRLHIDVFVFPYLLEFVNGQHDSPRIAFEIRQDILQRVLLLVFIGEGKRDLRRACHRVQSQQWPDASQ